MKLETATIRMDKFMAKHGLTQKGWKWKYDTATSRFGVCRYGVREIGLSKKLVMMNKWSHVRDTMLHEIAHALVGSGHSHDRVWSAKAISIGSNGKRCYTTKGEDGVKAVAKAFTLSCPTCTYSIQATRSPLRGKWCGKCFRENGRQRNENGDPKNPRMLVKKNKKKFGAKPSGDRNFTNPGMGTIHERVFTYLREMDVINSGQSAREVYPKVGAYVFMTHPNAKFSLACFQWYLSKFRKIEDNDKSKPKKKVVLTKAKTSLLLATNEDLYLCIEHGEKFTVKATSLEQAQEFAMEWGGEAIRKLRKDEY